MNFATNPTFSGPERQASTSRSHSIKHLPLYRDDLQLTLLYCIPSVSRKSAHRLGHHTDTLVIQPCLSLGHSIRKSRTLWFTVFVMARGRTTSTLNGSRKTADSTSASLHGHPQDQMPTIRLIPHQDPRSNRPSLAFPPTSRTLPHEDCVIRVGRYSERDINPNPPPNTPSSTPVGFKSKVVSRRHCEFWCSQGQWYIKDVKSSSGTFLNHIRLSQPSVESRPWPVNDGDVVQLGIDFRGGEEMIFRCVKIRVECNRAWQKTLNNYK